jgi:hypothetical protein
MDPTVDACLLTLCSTPRGQMQALTVSGQCCSVRRPI